MQPMSVAVLTIWGASQVSPNIRRVGLRLVTNPLIIGWADRQGGPFGVMLDDIFAGIFAALGVMALAALYHGVL